MVQRAYERNKMTRDISEMGMLAPSHVVWNVLLWVFMLCNATCSLNTLRKINPRKSLQKWQTQEVEAFEKDLCSTIKFLVPLSSSQSPNEFRIIQAKWGGMSHVHKQRESSFPIEVCFPSLFLNSKCFSLERAKDAHIYQFFYVLLFMDNRWAWRIQSRLYKEQHF